VLCDIDRDASQLFAQAGLQMTAQDEVEFATAERRRWLECLRSGRTLLASNATSLGFAKAADAAGVGAEIYIYPGAAHAFAQPLFNQGRTYDPIAAQTAWRLTEDFLRRRLN